MRLLYISILVIAGGITVGSAFAATFNESVTVNGNLNVNNGGMTFERTDNVFTSIKLKNNDKQVVFKFEDPDDNQAYLLRTTPGVNGNFELSDFSGASPVTRQDLVINRATGFMGVSEPNPTEQLHVDGNIKLSGNILSDGDICIGAC